MMRITNKLIAFFSLPRYSGGGLGWGFFANDKTCLTPPPPQPSPGVPGERAGIRRSSDALCRAAGALLVIFLLGGCATVKPWQREALADAIMQPDRNPMQSALLDHVYFSREAASGGRSVGGGGCGCN